MIRKFTLSAILSLCASVSFKLFAGTTYIDNGTSTTYTLNTGDTLYIATGTYTGVIGGFDYGATIIVSNGATFQPSSIPFPNVHGTMYIYGTFKMTTQLRTNSGFTLNNYGIVSLTSATLMSGSGQVWTNNYGAVLNMTGDVSMTNDNKLINYATINCGANFTMTGSTQLINKKNITINGNYTNSGGTLTNEGKFETIGSMTFNAGLAVVNNYCRLISSGGIYNTTGVFNNYSYVWAKDALGLGNIVNSGTIYNAPNTIIHSKNFNNTGIVTGAGNLYFTGLTATTNLGTTGTSGITTDTIKIYDITRANPLTIYDNQTGIVYPNVVYRAFKAPDSNRAYLPMCSAEILAEIPLATNANYFFVNLFDNIPGLTWSAVYDRDAIFEIQRSYDGINFDPIKKLPTEYGRSEYDFSDRQVNTQSPVVYYRIKTTGSGGADKYTATRMVKFSNKKEVTIHTAPNPFTSNFIINYQSAENEMIMIRVFNVSGQQKLAKNVVVHNGFNSINITEAAQLTNGMYIIQMSKGNNIFSSNKVIKQ